MVEVPKPGLTEQREHVRAPELAAQWSHVAFAEVDRMEMVQVHMKMVHLWRRTLARDRTESVNIGEDCRSQCMQRFEESMGFC